MTTFTLQVPRLLVTVSEFCGATMLGRSTVFGLLRDGKIASVLIGRSRRIPVQEMHDYVERLVGAGISRQQPRTP